MQNEMTVQRGGRMNSVGWTTCDRNNVTNVPTIKIIHLIIISIFPATTRFAKRIIQFSVAAKTTTTRKKKNANAIDVRLNQRLKMTTNEDWTRAHRDRPLTSKTRENDFFRARIEVAACFVMYVSHNSFVCSIKYSNFSSSLMTNLHSSFAFFLLFEWTEKNDLKFVFSSASTSSF